MKPAHRKPIHVRDYIAYGLVQFSRWSFDKITGYSPKTSLTPEGWLQRFIFGDGGGRFPAWSAPCYVT